MINVASSSNDVRMWQQNQSTASALREERGGPARNFIHEETPDEGLPESATGCSAKRIFSFCWSS